MAVLLIPTVEEAVVLAHFIKRLSQSYDDDSFACPNNGDTCYDFRSQPSLENFTCTYNYISMQCQGKGELRYVTEYHYW